MGGTGGKYFESDIDDLKKKLLDSEEQSENAQHDAAVASVLTTLLTEYNDRNTDAISRHLLEIQAALEKDLEGTIDLLFGGSVAKHTYVDGLSDIDSLVILDNCELASGRPEQAKEYFAEQLKLRFPKTPVDIGRLAVTIRFSDAEIQLLPAISCQSDVKISDESGRRWSQISPREFTDVLSKTNQQVGRKVVPVVKLAKAIIANLPDKHQVSGYHAESLAIEVFKNYKGDLHHKEMLKYFFEKSSQLVSQPIRDRTGQSVHVDDYLGQANSLERRIVADAFLRVNRRMRNADRAGSTDEWKKLFGQE